MQKKCAQCGKDFEAKRKTAMYCSGSCKTTAGRGSSPQKVDKANDLMKKVQAVTAHHDAIVADPQPEHQKMYMDGHEQYLAMPKDQQQRVIFLMGCCRVSKSEAIKTVLENDKE